MLAIKCNSAECSNNVQREYVQKFRRMSCLKFIVSLVQGLYIENSKEHRVTSSHVDENIVKRLTQHTEEKLEPTKSYFFSSNHGSR
jgi:hypothetical protein